MLDIKLKNNKKIGVLIAVIITALFSACFMALYPTFEKKADMYYKDSLLREDFLGYLYRGNYIVYKDIREKKDGTNYNYEDLYLKIEEEYVPGAYGKAGEESSIEDGLDYGGIDALPSEMRYKLENIFMEWEEEFRNEFARRADYCVIDEETGELIKNTGRNIEALAASGADSEKQKLPYIYYVMVTYDEAGNPDRAAVKGANSDELLKSVQAIMKSKNLEKEFNYVYENGYYVKERSYYGISGLDNRMTKVSCAVYAPRKTTFIYALTQEQKDKMTNGGMIANGWEEWYAYARAGVGEVYWVFLIVLTILAFLMMLNKKYCLHHNKAVKAPFELTAFLVIMIAGGFHHMVIELVSDTNRGYFNTVWNQYLFFIPAESYEIATGAVNFGCLFLLFGGWFYAVSTLGELFTYGIKGFLKERSILLRFARRIGKWAGKIVRKFKDELLHVDLDGDVEHTLHKIVLVNFIVLGILCSMWFFGWFGLIVYSLALYFLLKKYIGKLQNQYKKLLGATGSIAEGNLHTTFEEDFGVFESYKDALHEIQEGFRKAVDEEVKSQRMKAELITNVSHDLKTPLTAITTYIDLLKEDGITQEQREEYIGVLEKKSLRLKTLIEDLFEVSKANSRNVTVNLVEVDIANLVRQVYLEYEDKIEEANLDFRFRMPKEKIVLKLDSQKTYRIFENLYSNTIKYAMTGSRVYIDLEKLDGKVVIGLRNMSAVELHVAPEELTERFVRGDSSRNTEGSGLGLAIAKSFTEIQGGTMEVVVDGDLFKVMLAWKCEE